jgi:histidinol phosphatase-like enzyme
MEYKKVIAFDLDDVLCQRSIENNTIEKYALCEPIQRNIDIVNNLYADGYKILIYTARGMITLKGDLNKIETVLRDITEKQLSKWGVKYHKLHMGKIFYDVLIDDKALNSYRMKNVDFITDFFKEENSA